MERTATKAAEAKFNLSSFLAQYGTLIGLMLIIILFTILKPAFLKPQSVIDLLRQASINGFLAIGMTFVILTGGIDLSVGSIVGAAGIYAALIAQNHDYPAFIPVLVGIMIGFSMGLFNGVTIAFLKVPAFIGTLGMLSIARGITFMATDAKPVPQLSPQFLEIGKGSILGIPIPVIILVISLLVCIVLLYASKFGRYVFAVGGSEQAALVSGIKVRTVKASTYAISGLLSGLAGVILTARVSSGLAQSGTGYETDAIAAVVIGGTSLAGGRGRLWGTVVGFLLIAVLNKGLDMLAVSSYLQLIIKGFIIIAAVMVDGLTQKD